LVNIFDGVFEMQGAVGIYTLVGILVVIGALLYVCAKAVK
jgi:hypothetical protein